MNKVQKYDFLFGGNLVSRPRRGESDHFFQAEVGEQLRQFLQWLGLDHETRERANRAARDLGDGHFLPRT